MSERDGGCTVGRADREGMSHRRHVPAAGTSEGPGTVVPRAQAGGFGAPDDYRADHGYQAISTHPPHVMDLYKT